MTHTVAPRCHHGCSWCMSKTGVQSENCGNSNDATHTVLAAAPSAQCWRQAREEGQTARNTCPARLQLRRAANKILQTASRRHASDSAVRLGLSTGTYTGTQRHLSCCATCTRPCGRCVLADRQITTVGNHTWQRGIQAPSEAWQAAPNHGKQMEPKRTAKTLQTAPQALHTPPHPTPLPPLVCGDRQAGSVTQRTSRTPQHF